MFVFPTALFPNNNGLTMKSTLFLFGYFYLYLIYEDMI